MTTVLHPPPQSKCKDTIALCDGCVHVGCEAAPKPFLTAASHAISAWVPCSLPACL